MKQLADRSPLPRGVPTRSPEAGHRRFAAVAWLALLMCFIVGCGSGDGSKRAAGKAVEGVATVSQAVCSAGQCNIAGNCVADGTQDLGNDCNVCASAKNATGWTRRNTGSCAPGVIAQYFDNITLDGSPAYTRFEPTIDHEWATGPGNPLGSAGFSARYTGQIRVDTSDTYTFETESDDGVRLWVNGVLLVDAWVDQGATRYSGSIVVVAGTRYDLKLEYYQSSDAAVIKLRYSNAAGTVPNVIVPSTQLYATSAACSGCGDSDPCTLDACAIGTDCVHPSAPDGTDCAGGSCQSGACCTAGLSCTAGLTGDYYGNITLSGQPILERLDGAVDHEWLGSPGGSVPADGFSVRWAGQISVDTTDTYSFAIDADDGARVFIDGVLVVDAWANAANYLGTIDLAAGVRYDIKVELYDTADRAAARLYWSNVDTLGWEPVPSTHLYAGAISCGNCDDADPCTKDRCSTAGQCAHPPNADGIACTGGKCQGGACCTGCDDGDVCTQDLCAAGGGCDHPPSTNGIACGGGTCQSGSCCEEGKASCVAGLKGEYFANAELSGQPVLTRIDGNLDLDYWGSPGPGVPDDVYSVRWTGQIAPPTTDNYTFFMGAVEGARVWLDGKLIFDAWDTGQGDNVQIHLAGGVRYDIKAEIFTTSSHSAIHLGWYNDGGTVGWQTVPSTALYAAVDTCGGCSDGDPCTEDRCSTSGQCAYPPADDGVACSGGQCQSGVCCTGCSDGDPCTKDLCADGGACAHPPSDNNIACSGGTCQSGSCCPAGNTSCLAGLEGEYFANTELSGAPVLTRIDRGFDNEWWSSPGAGLPDTGYSVRWTGQIYAPTTDTYTFIVADNTGSRIWIDGKLVWDNWDGHDPGAPRVPMVGGVRYDIRAELVVTDVPGQLQVSWYNDSNTVSWQQIAGTYFFVGQATCGNCDDGDPCTEDRCSASGQCVHPAADDGVACSGGQCQTGVCCTGCSDGDPCTKDVCLDGGACGHPPSDDNIACNGGTCQSGACCAAGNTACLAGLKGEYFANTDLSGAPVLTRIDSNLDQEWWGSPGPGVPEDNFSVRWTGQIAAPTTDTYTFILGADDAARIWLDGTLIFDTLNGEQNDARVPMVAGVRYDIKAELYENTDRAMLHLQWYNDANTVSWQAVSSRNFFVGPAACDNCDDGDPCTRDRCTVSGSCVHPAADDGITCSGGICQAGTCCTGCSDGDPCTKDVCLAGGGCGHPPATDGIACSGGSCQSGLCCPAGNASCLAGLKGEYFANTNLSGTPVLTRIDANLDNEWWTSPGPGVPDTNYSVRWTGQIYAPTTDIYTFQIGDNTGSRIWVDGKLIWDNLANSDPEAPHLKLVGGVRYDIKVELVVTDVPGQLQVSWYNDANTISWQPISSTYFFVGQATCGACNDNDPCTEDRCTITNQCTHIAADDGLTCSGGGICQTGTCCRGCDDGDPCTQDVCLAGGACSHPPVTDGNACNGGTCQSGACCPAADASCVAGLKGEYFASPDFSGAPVLTRIDSNLGLEWWGSPGNPVPEDNFSVRWTGQIAARDTDTYTFAIGADDFARVWIDGRLILDTFDNNTQDQARVALVGGVRYDIKAELGESTDRAMISLYWQNDSRTVDWQLVPSTNLFAAPADCGACDDGQSCTVDHCTTTKVCAHQGGPNGAACTGGTCQGGRCCTEGLSCTAGLTGEYFADMDLSGTPAFTRVDETVDFDWGNDSPDARLPADGFSVRWRGQVLADVTDTYSFETETDDGVRLSVNDQSVVDDWEDMDATKRAGTVALVAGHRYDVVLEYYEHAGGAVAKLRWQSASGAVQYQIVPNDHLFAGAPACAGCDDGNPCTQDHCAAGGSCTHSNAPDSVLHSTTCGVGACAATGSLTCSNGAVHDTCTPATAAATDTTCDGVDDNCNGTADDGYVPRATTCGSGACAATGATGCVNGAETDSCHAGTHAANDATCNGVDDDCDGQVDENYVPHATSCGVGACAATGTSSCQGGVEHTGCTPLNPAANDATCNGVDDDCDSVVDEDYVSIATSCGVGPCASTGTSACVMGQVLSGCVPGTPAASDATCNGVDDNCNGAVDEGYAGHSTTCGAGACQVAGTTTCVAGAEHDSCSAGTGSGSDTTCNGIDDNCNGQIDEGYVSHSTSCGVGACARTGTTSCTAGVEHDSCSPGTPAATDTTCNGIDDNCNGQVDEGYAPHSVTCGVGACVRSGSTACTNGAETQSCTPGNAASSDTTCDGVDDNCNGAVDDGYAPHATTCGVGACVATGTSSCSGGAEQTGCTAGTPAATDTTCNGVDDNCNGVKDEGYIGQTTHCGQGACAASGTTSCASGVVVDSCAPGTPALNDATCNGIDDDCNGQVDEDYLQQNTSCGVGACGRTGVRSCAGGVVTDSCAPGTPAANDATCDGVDDDCDGQIDENYASHATTCGVGACAATGTASCVSGHVQDTCSPGTPAADDVTCDGVDDDCNGSVDDGYGSHATTCGSGACTASGTATCVSGHVQDTCHAGTGATSDTTCNGVDDDCDGSTDEDYVPHCSASSLQTCSGGIIVTTSCDDGNVCNGPETCTGSACAPGSPLVIDDNNPCTTDACNPASGATHAPAAQGTSCGAGLVCNGQGSCVGGGGTTPAILTQPVNVQVSAGQPFQFSVSASGTGITFQWQRFGADVPGATSAVYSNPSAAFSDNGAVYHVVVANGAGSVTSVDVTLTVADDQPPVLTVDGAFPQSTNASFVTLTGVATDTGSGIQSVTVASDKFSGQSFGAVVDAQGRFSAEIPLSLGDNHLVVKATDKAAKTTTQNVVVTQALTSVPVVSITSPTPGATVTTNTVNVTGTVRSSLPPEQVRLTLGTVVTFPTGSGGVYAFTFANVRLIQGPNLIHVQADTPQGSSSAEVTVTYQTGSQGDTGTPPRISVNVSQADNFITGNTAPVAGTVEADDCVSLVKVNGTQVTVAGAGKSVSFDATVTFATGSSSLTVTVEATDCSSRTSFVSYVLHRDATPPIIDVPGLGTGVNTVIDNPYTISGTVTEQNLAGFTVGNQSVSVMPGSAPNTWQFSVPLSLARGQDTTVTLEAWDSAGNRTPRDVVLRFDATVAIRITSPAQGADLVGTTEPPSVAVAATIDNLAATDTVVAIVDNGAPVSLGIAGALASGTVPVPNGATHSLTVEVHAQNGQSVARSTVSFKFTPSSALPLKVVTVDPPNEAVNVEVQQRVAVFFNKTLDPTHLTVELTETVHGLVYDRAAPGADLTSLSSVNLVQVNRDNQAVPGGISHIPNDTMVAFYPSRDFGYAGTVHVSVKYDGNELARSQFQVRPLPTLVQGFVASSHLEPLAGVQVELTELGLKTTTNADGYYGFGFGDFANAIPGGQYRMRVNSGLAAGKYGTQEQWVNAQSQRLTSVGILRLLLVDPAEPFRHAKSGDATVQLAGGSVVLGLGSAAVTFPSGANEGDLHAQAVSMSDLSYYSQPFAMPQFAYSVEPGGVQVSGDASVTLALPAFQDGYGYIDGLPAHALLVGLDPGALELVPVGVVSVDKPGRRLVTVGHVALRRLDYLGVSLTTAAREPALAAYAAGQIDLRELTSRLQALQ